MHHQGGRLMDLVRKIEKKYPVVMGAGVIPKSRRLGPFGLVYVGPVFDGPVPPSVSYWRQWRHASGIEFALLGRAVYIAYAPRSR